MTTPKELDRPEGSPPQGAVARPQLRGLGRRRAGGLAGAAVALLAPLVAMLAIGCESAGNAQVSSPFVVAIGATEKPTYSDANLSLYESQTPVAFPVRRPTGSELGALPHAVSPYPRSPFLLASDETVEIDYTVTNLDNQSNTVWLLIDPWNEFVRYKPGVTVVSQDESEPNLSGIQLPILLLPHQRIQGNISAQDMSNLALKLDTAMQIMATTFAADATYGAGTLLNHDFNTQNIPGPGDPLLASYTPKVVAGLTGFDLGLQSYSPMNVAIEVTVNVLDASGAGKVVAAGTTTGLLGAPPGVLKMPGAK